MMKHAASYVLIFFAVILYACATPGSYSISKVNGAERAYRYDEGGKKVLVYETDRNGKLTVYDENDPRAKQRMAQQEMGEKVEQANADRIEKIKKARKRRPRDPIYVYLRSVDISEDLKKVEKPKGALAKQVRKEFEKDRIIKLVGKDKVNTGDVAGILSAMKGGSSQKAPGSDVDVSVRAYTKEVYGMTKQGKPGKMVALVLEATVKSNYLPDTFRLEESGNLLLNTKVINKFGAKVKKAVIDRVGPTIPADRSL